MTQKMIPRKICNFCQKEAKYKSSARFEKHNLVIYFCDACDAEYIFWATGELAATHLYTTINDKCYRWSVSKNSKAKLWYIREPGESGVRLDQNLKRLKSFASGSYSEITPANIKDKIKFMLLFL
jgi:hypothetical protein